MYHYHVLNFPLTAWCSSFRTKLFFFFLNQLLIRKLQKNLNDFWALKSSLKKSTMAELCSLLLPTEILCTVRKHGHWYAISSPMHDIHPLQPFPSHPNIRIHYDVMYFSSQWQGNGTSTTGSSTASRASYFSHPSCSSEDVKQGTTTQQDEYTHGYTSLLGSLHMIVLRWHIHPLPNSSIYLQQNSDYPVSTEV